MGCLWHPTNLEAGIDGYIELRDPITEEVTNCIVLVQSKATRVEFSADNATSLSYYCKPEDLDLWLSGNAPVILVHSRPKTNEAYWCSVKDRFPTPESRKSKTIHFNKVNDRFDLSARDAIAKLAVPKDSGLYLSALPRSETIESNLLHVSDFPETYFVAPTEFDDGRDLKRALRELAPHSGQAWLLKGKMLYSLYDLSKHPWSAVCDTGAIEEFQLEEWAFTDDLDERKSFVDMLRRALIDTLMTRQIGYDPSQRHFYFWSTKDLSERVVRFQARQNNSKRTVFKTYKSRKDPERASYCRHYAFESSFTRVGNRWYLQLNPTYRFTKTDGKTIHPFAASLLSGIRRQDRSLAVANIIVMWSSYLSQEDLFTRDSRLLGFGKLATFELPVGIDDKAWMSQEDDASRLVAADDEQGDVQDLL